MNWLSNRKSIVKWVALSMLLSAGSAAPVLAQATKPEVVLPPTAIGDWVKLDTVGVGTFENFSKYAAKPKLTPAGQAMADSAPDMRAAFGASYKVGKMVVVRPHPCGYSGVAFGGLEYSSYAFHVVKSKDEVVIAEEISSAYGRHIYLDGRPIPPPSLRTPTAVGYSVGHIEPDGTLVIETGDMTESKGGFFGPPHTPETVLEQRYQPSPSGDHMKITYIWKDPKIFAEPFKYSVEFDRLAPHSVAFESYCDPTDVREATSSVEPDQK